MPDNNRSSDIRDKSFCSEENLTKYLRDKGHFSLEEQQQLKYYIDNYSDCWRIWNKVRWDAAMHTQGVEELKEYLGKDFVPYYDSSWELAKEWTSQLRYTKQAIEGFYKNTKNYIYNSVIFFYSEDRINLRNSWVQLLEQYKIKSVVDYGCGVGNDGLSMIKEGVNVTFCDFDSPTLKFLRWRIKKRKIDSSLQKVKTVEELRKNPQEADMFWAVDVIEHMQNPMEIFDCIHPQTHLIVFFTDCDDKAGGRHPFHFKVNKSLLEEEFIKRSYKKISHEFLDIWKKRI